MDPVNGVAEACCMSDLAFILQYCCYILTKVEYNVIVLPLISLKIGVTTIVMPLPRSRRTALLLRRVNTGEGANITCPGPVIRGLELKLKHPPIHPSIGSLSRLSVGLVAKVQLACSTDLRSSFSPFRARKEEVCKLHLASCRWK